MIFINLSHHFCPFTTEGKQVHWDFTFSLLEDNSNDRHPNWINYKELVENQLRSLQDISVNMRVKDHFLHSHLDTFRIIAVSKENDFIRISKQLKSTFPGRCDKRMIADYCKSIKLGLRQHWTWQSETIIRA